MKTPKALPYVLACSAMLLWCGDLTAEVPGGARGLVGPVIPELLKYDLQTLELPAAGQQPFTTAVRLGDQMQTLILEPYSMRADDFRVLVQGEDGQLQQVESPPSRTYRGTVQGEPQSRVAGSLIDGQLWATVGLESGEIWHIQPLSDMGVAGAPNASHVIYQGKDVVPTDGTCGTDDIAQPNADRGDQERGGIAMTGTGVFATDIAFDADFEYFSVWNGGSVTATVADIENIWMGVEFVYERDTDITYEITTFVIRTTVDDPYTSTNPETLLNQFRNTWASAPENFIRRDVAQLFTGKNLNGSIIGIAWLASLCADPSGLGYGVVQSRYTGNMDLRVSLSAHEAGHNWAAGHCSGGTCHIMCAGIGGCGGVFGSNLKFGPVSIGSIVSFRNTRPCLFEQPLPLALPFFDELNETLDTNKWTYNFGALVTSLGVNEPSGVRSLNLDGGPNIYDKDEVRSNVIELAGQEGAILSYYTEHIGVEADESLFVEYWAPNKTWKIINVVVSDGTNQTLYDFFTHDLPGDAFHDEFRLRFRTDSNQSDDDWFVDDVFIGMGASCPWDLDGNGSIGASDLLSLLASWGPCKGCPGDFDGNGIVGASDLLALLANWGPCP